MLPITLSLPVAALEKPFMSKIRSNRSLRQTSIYMIAQSVPLQTKGHTYAMCIYTVGRRPPQSHSEHDLKFSRFLQVRRNVKQTSSFKIGQAMDFYLVGDSSPAIHSKTSAKVIKRIGFTKFWVFFLA